MTRAKSKSGASALKKWVLLINLFFVLLLLLTYLTPYMPVEKWGWLSLLALAYPFIMLINGSFALAWVMARKWIAMFSIVAMLLGWNVHNRYVKLIPLGEKGKCEESIRLLSYNMRGLSIVPAEEGASRERKIEMLHEALSDLKEYPDIFAIQEGAKADYIGKKFGLNNIIHGSKSSLWLLSRYPIIKQGELKGDESNPFCIWADMKTDAGILRVYNMHLMSNRVTGTTEELIQDMDFQKEYTWNKIRFIVSRYKYTTKKRSAEATKLWEHIQQSPHPAILMGDGNDTPISHTYHILAKHMKDSFRKRGVGFSTTYESQLPLLRIDYLMGTQDIQFKDHQTHRLSYSDHYPISAGICIRSHTSS